ncbi:MAG: tetratricopeptide repeat protein [Bacteroidetes bacterium]|nr:tetratricopeptide repeat protein [Bacteroidota bacterium]
MIVIITILISSISFAQEIDKALQKSNDYVYDGNKLVDEDFVAAEKEYRKAISEKPSNISGAYNLGNAYYKSGYYSEALLRHIEAVNSATTKTDKHQAFHNIGNALMQQKQCKEAVEAFKNALRNDPTDDQTRYNLALAKECAKEQGGGGDDDKEDEDKKDGEDKEDENKDKGDDKEDKKDGDDKDDKDGKPKDEKEDNDKESPKKEKKKQRQQPKLSPQQVKNLLEAMNNQEKKVQDKINAKKVKGVKVKTEKDW